MGNTESSEAAAAKGSEESTAPEEEASAGQDEKVNSFGGFKRYVRKF